MPEEKILFTNDCRSREPIFDKADAVCIMAKKGDSILMRETLEDGTKVKKYVKLENDFIVGEKQFSNRKKGVYSKEVKYRVTLGWVLKKNLGKEDLSRADYLKDLEENQKLMYEDVEEKVKSK